MPDQPTRPIEQPYNGAPYNFVGLPRQPRSAKEDVPEAWQYQTGRVSGWFDCTLETRTPLYIRNTLTRTQYAEKLAREAQNIKKEYTHDVGSFFAPGEAVRLPGSSLRGMIRTLVEIMSESQFLFTSSSQLFFRAVGGQTAQSVVQAYRGRLQAGTQSLSKVKAGYMVKKGGQYVIYPAQALNGATFYQVFTDTLRFVNGAREWKRKPIWYKLPPMGKLKPFINEVRSRENNAAAPTGQDWLKGWLVISGYMNGKKRSWIITERDSSAQGLEVPLKDVQDYRDAGGVTPAIEAKTFSVLPENSGEGCPCFYLEWEDQQGQKRVSFGHTGYFRLPYEHNVKDLVAREYCDPAKWPPDQFDLAEAIFGRAADRKRKSAAGRVFFEDAQPEGEVRWETTGPVPPQILSGPKPTTFQHYLDQSEASQRGNPRDQMSLLKFWDSSGATIRGYKLYWHRRGTEWQAKEGAADTARTQYTQMQPLKAGNKFRFRVRFDNLSGIELGALAAALELPSGCAHKLGMGKPLGLGSVRVTAELKVIDRRQRYGSLFSTLEGTTAQWQTGLDPGASSLTTYQDQFATWLNDRKPARLSQIWETRWRELYALLDWEQSPPSSATRYMEIDDKEHKRPSQRPNEYTGRPILPTARQIWEEHRVITPTDPVAEAEGDIGVLASTEDLKRLLKKFKR